MMRRAQFEEALRSHLWRTPFKPFIIELEDGRQLVIEQKQMLSYFTGDSALYLNPDGSGEFIDNEAVTRIVEKTAQTPA